MTPKYLCEARDTAAGAKGVAHEGGAGRRSAMAKSVESLGAKLETLDYAFVIVDRPDDVSAAALALAVNQSGAASAKTVAPTTPEDIDKAGKKAVAYGRRVTEAANAVRSSPACGRGLGEGPAAPFSRSVGDALLGEGGPGGAGELLVARLGDAGPVGEGQRRRAGERGREGGESEGLGRGNDLLETRRRAATAASTRGTARSAPGFGNGRRPHRIVAVSAAANAQRRTLRPLRVRPLCRGRQRAKRPRPYRR